MLKKFLYILLFTVIASEAWQSHAQNRKIDSLLTLLKTDKEDTNKVNHLNALGLQIMYSNPDTAIILSSQALVIAKSLLCGETEVGWKKGISNSIEHFGVYYTLKGNYPKALDYYFKALKIYEELNYKKGMASCLGNIGSIYAYQTDYPKALDYYFKALKMDEELENKNGIASRLGNIGTVYANQADYPKALDYYFKALKMDEKFGDKYTIAADLGYIGSVYAEQADYPKALTYYFKALKMAEELGDKKLIAVNLGNIGWLYADTKKYPEAEKYLLEALKIDKEIGAQDDERQFEELVSKLYETTGREKLALLHYKKAILLKDTLFSAENKKQLIKKEMNFEFEKKEALAKAEQEKQSAVAAAESKKQQIVIVSVIGCLLLVIVFSIFLFNRFRITQKQKIIIENQKEQVDKAYESLHEKNKEVMDSINYASRIQRALLPSQKYIANNLNKLMRN